MMHLTASPLPVLLLLASYVNDAAFMLAENDACPQFCACISNQLSQAKIECLVSTETEWKSICSKLAADVTSHWREIDLRMLGNSSTFLTELSCLPELESLDLSGTYLTITESTFHGLKVTSFLNISNNEIRKFPKGIFSGFEHLTKLDLSHNALSALDSDLFQELISLKWLDVSFNNLNGLCLTSFSSVQSLEYVNLGNNKIQELSPLYFPSSLKTLNLRDNLLTAIRFTSSNVSTLPLQNLSSLDISENPLECSCYLQKLLHLLPNLRNILKNSEETTCISPPTLIGRSLQSLNVSDLPCSAPKNLITYPSNSKSVQSFSSVVLECEAEGYPKPTIIWITPWNDVFLNRTNQMLPIRELQSFNEKKSFTYREYEEPNVFLVSYLHLTSNNELVITNFRGSMSGNFTCLAVNAAGNISTSFNLSVFSLVKPTYFQSLLIGGYSATGFLIFGFLIGFVKIVVIWLRQKFCFIVPFFSKPPSSCNAEDAASITVTLDVVEKKSESDGSNSESGAGLSIIPLLVQEKEFGEFHLPDSNEDLDETNCSANRRTHYSIIESIEEAKGRLRYGVGRKMERVRKNVLSIKESGTVYMHTIVETGSSAASRMKAGMAMGVETVKYHVQSFKELCGTGDMGTQTISMVSVETDVDSHQQKEIIRQITYV